MNKFTVGLTVPPPFKANEAVKEFSAQDAVPNNEAVTPELTVNDPEISALPVYGKGGIYESKYEAVSAYVDQDAVPNNEPVMPLSTFNEPVMVWLPINVFEPVVAKLPDLATNIGSVSW